MKKTVAFLFTIFFASSIFANDISVGFVLVGPSTDGGWSMRHHQGFHSLTKHGYNVEGVESVAEADSERVFKKLARKHDIVFGTSFGFMESMVRAASSRKGTIFMHATGFKGNDKNMDNYVCHSFQARYLTGIAAGMMTKTNKIGVVGSHPIPEIIRNINALTLGAQSVNPDIEVSIVWINSWFDPPKDMDAAKVLADQNNDILFTTTDSPSVVALAQQRAEQGQEIWSMGNDAPMGQFGPDRYITGMMFNWNVLYKEIVDQLAEGKLKMGQRWNWGLQENCVGLSPWGKNVPGEVVNKVETVKMDWINDKMDTWYPFSEGVTKQDGSKIKAGVMKRPELETMQFFVKGVNSPFPTK
tara:strand:+ start:168 stop:1238 length:1071 start_codon:yes stop_codon:yes gene_type:complete